MTKGNDQVWFANSRSTKGHTMTTLQEVHKFLLGEGPIDGVWLGDYHPTVRGNYWWRKHLRAALAQQEPENSYDLAKRADNEGQP